jgi:chromosome segregation ATPase
VDLAVVIPLVGIAVTGLVTYIVASRRMSGKIATSDATDLWKESQSIRDDYRDRLDQSNGRTVRLEERLAILESRNVDLARENVVLQGQIHACERLGDELRAIIERLEQTIEELRK